MLFARSSSSAVVQVRRVAAVLAGSALLALSAQAAVPMWPVPVTLQTLAIPVLVALFGTRLAVASVLAYLAEAAVGLPVLQGFAGGLHAFVGPTAGYLAGFPVAAWIIGTLYEHRMGRSYVERFAAIFIGTALIFVGGALWLAFGLRLGMERAAELGVAPFLVGDVAKCLIAAALRPRRPLV